MLTRDQIVKAERLMAHLSRPRRSKRCTIKTTKGKRCKNRATFPGMCTVHFKRAQESLQMVFKGTKRSRLEKVERTINLAGGIAGLIAGIIEVVQFAVGYWDTLTIGLDSRAHDREAHGISLKFQRLCIEMDGTDITTEGDLQKFGLAFEHWFSNLSRYTQGRIESKFGATNINELRATLRTLRN